MLFLVLLVLLCIALAVVGFVYAKKRKQKEYERQQQLERLRIMQKEREKKRKADASGEKLSLWFGSQTGTAEGFAKDLATMSKKYGFSPEVKDLEDFDEYEFENEKLAIFIVATYGEGDPTDNAIDFDKWLKDEDNSTNLDQLGFAVFGLGNRQYEHYNKIGKDFDKRLEELGAKRVYKLGDGDDDGTLEDDFEEWKEDIFKAFSKHAFPDAPEIQHDAAADDSEPTPPTYLYRSVTVAAPTDSRIAKTGGRFNAKLDAHPTGKLDLSSKHYFETVPCKVVVNRELRKSAGADGLGSTMHVEVDIRNTGLSYTTADTLAICPENNPDQVKMLARWLGLDLDEWFTLEADAENQSPLFPTPCTVRTALSCYCAINAIPTRSFLGRLAHLAQRAEHRKRLFFLASKEGKEEYKSWVIENKLNICDMFESFPSIQPDIGKLMETLPRLQPRDYTISSSSKVTPNRIHITASTVTEIKPGPGKVKFEGVCTGALTRKQPFVHEPRTKRPEEEKGIAAEWPTVYAFVRPSTFILSKDASIPLILIGPGTGLAPMRACLQERRWQRENDMNPGETLLFFGCRTRDEDFIYEDEIMDYCQTGDISSFYPAFSREQEEKVYVQHLIKQHGEQVWNLVHEMKAYVFVCGATTMGKDVHNTLMQIAIDNGMSQDEAKAYFDSLKEQGRFVQELWS